MFFTNWVGADVVNPVVNVSISGKGKVGGWFGWPEDAKMEAMRDAFARSSAPEEQRKIAADIQKEVYDQVIYIPLGQYFAPSAWRKSLTGVLDGPATPLFWNVDKSEWGGGQQSLLGVLPALRSKSAGRFAETATGINANPAGFRFGCRNLIGTLFAGHVALLHCCRTTFSRRRNSAGPSVGPVFHILLQHQRNFFLRRHPHFPALLTRLAFSPALRLLRAFLGAFRLLGARGLLGFY